MEYITSDNFLFIGSILLFVSILMGKTGYKFGVPALLLFLLVGMLFGSDGLGIQFNNMHAAQFIGMVALSIILFSGGMDTRFADIRPVLGPGTVLSTAGVLLTALLTGTFVWWLSGMSWTNIHFAFVPSLLLAAMMSSTDSASVFAILRSQKMHLKNNLRPMLELESGSNDPMAYMLTIVLIQLTQAGSGASFSGIIQMFVVQFLVGGAVGYMLGWIAVKMLNRLNIDNQSLYPILLIAVAFFTLSVTDLIGGNGYLAVYITGIIIGNNRIPHRREIATFMDGLTWLFQIIMFIMLGLLVNPHEMLDVALVALLIGLFMIFVGRPLSVMFCLLPFRHITMRSRLFISWVGLRGAVPIIFATYPVVAGIEGSDLIFNIVFFITIISLVVQGTTLSQAARFLKLSAPLEKTGNEFGVELPEEIGSDLSEVTVTSEMLEEADTLRDMNLPTGTLVMIVKRNDEFLIPNGTLRLHEGDKLLLISEGKK
ncbi:potassium/proton antiporter [Tannerella forsythia]|uniref:Potassium/proton antiporter n=1 Tax=Tannerella forsythia TaxID=28112 RepID=A0A3P1XWH7_TANFO|nr:potassium/proton antiporter [Tannerella forsythia]RRD62855.1 potassium/proton antiporter [Tannerella forsythia]RRD77431.1 potassium/proton antiporter [Tannerella forsythia]